MRLPVTDVRFVPRPVSRARRQGTSDELAVLRAEASTNAPRERVPARTREDDDLSTGLREPERQRARVWSNDDANSRVSSSEASANALDALRREGAKRPEFVIAMATAFLRPSATERLLTA
jgi:hypothetical protein